MNCIKNERIKNEIIKNERIKNERIKNELIKKRTDPKNSPKITRVKYEEGPPQLPIGSKIYLELRITFFGWTGLYNFYNILLFDSENC